MWHEKYLELDYYTYNCARLLQKVWLDEFNYYLQIKTNENDITEYSQAMQLSANDLIRIDAPVDKCAVLMYSRSGVMGHVGVWVDWQDGYILHAHKDFTKAVLEPASVVFSKNKLAGFYTCN